MPYYFFCASGNKNRLSVKSGETVDNNVTVDDSDLGAYSFTSNTDNTAYPAFFLN